MNLNFNIIRILLSLLLLLPPALAWAAPGSALLKGIMQKSSAKPVSASSEINPTALLEEIKLKLAATGAELAAMPTEATDSITVELSENKGIFVRRAYLKQLVFAYQSILSRLNNLQSRKQHRLELENQAANWSGFSAPSPHPFLQADNLKESIASLNNRIDELEPLITMTDQAEAQLAKTIENSTVKLRQADEAVEQAKTSPDLQARLDRERGLLTLQNQLDLARILALQIEKQSTHEELLEIRAKLQLANKQLSMSPEQVGLTQSDIDQAHKNLDSESQHIIAELKQEVSALDFDHKAEQPGASGAATPAQVDQIRQAQQDNTDIKLQALNRILLYLQMQRDIWDLRWAFAKVTDREKAGEAYEKITRNQAVLTMIRDYINRQRHRLLVLVTDQSVNQRDTAMDGSDAVSDKIKNLDLDQIVSYSRMLGAIESTQNLLDRSKQELDARFAVKSFSDYLMQTWLTARDVTAQVWQFELLAVQDNIEVNGQIISGKRSVTVDKVSTALAILIVGYWLAVRLARLVEGLSVTRLGMDASLARIARRWILFIEVILLVVLSMLVVRIPLTIFAFMGGALAIGAGFGMQNMLKNLISGLMLLFERPFRPGDVVEVGGIRGRVTDIGVRSSHIIDSNGIETLIPNSTFIEQNVTSWTLSSKSVRIVINIGIAYGSPLKEVSRLLLEIANRHGMVLKEPAPQVLFEDFASDSLLFGLYVWVEINPDVSWKTIASDLRYMINKTLAEHDIVIAFPQRDIHLNSSRPLEVRVLADAADTGNAKD
jgi:small-conductance mechanosensitive channel